VSEEPDKPKQPAPEVQDEVQPTPKWLSWTARAVVLLASIATVLLHVPLRVFPLARDQGVWLTAAMGMSGDKMFFREFLHFNLPGTAFAYWIAWKLAGDPMIATVALSAAISVLIVIALYLLLRDTVGIIAGLWAAVIFACMWPMKITWWSIAQKDFLAVPWILFAAWTAAKAAPDYKYRKAMLLVSGALTVLAAQFKPTFILLGVLMAAAIFGRHLWINRFYGKYALAWTQIKQPAREILLYIAGGALGFIPLLLYLFLGDALDYAYYCLTCLGPAYMAASRWSFSSLAEEWWKRQYGTRFLFSWPMLVICAYGLLVWVLSFKNKKRIWLLPPALMALASFFLQGKGMGYHMIPWYIMMIAFGGVALQWSWRSDNFKPFKLKSVLHLILIPALLAGSGYGMFTAFTGTRYAHVEYRVWKGEIPRDQYLRKYFSHRKDYPNPALSEELARWIAGRTKPDDKILVWGHECQIYVLADRLYATQAPFDQCLSSIDLQGDCAKWHDRQKTRFLALLDAEKPVYFIVTTKDRNVVEKLSSDRAMKNVPGLKDYLRRKYTQVRTMQRFIIYKRRSG